MTIVFDLDGTLIDTYPILKFSLEKVFAIFTPHKAYTIDDIDDFFGPPLIVSFEKWVKDKDLAQRMVTAYRQISEDVALQNLVSFPNTKAVLQALRNQKYHSAICSNKIHSIAHKHLKMCGIDDYFDMIIGGDDVVYHKPHPEGIFKIKEQYDDVVMMVGDSPIDIRTAKNAKILAVGVAKNEKEKFKLQKEDADYIIEDIMDVLEIVKEL